ncbi:MAG: hypothetical protein JRJ87_26795, partial [Deltaproteobacteria bacterium]|nr:hypothetical protein [Deltaproteobacteria bacterium]
LKNTSGLPWTTGPALLMQNGRPLGQDLLSFTPPKTDVRLPVTAAVSVRGTTSEKELGRTKGAEKYGSYNYTRINNRKTFKVVNSLDRSIRLIITADLNGKCTATSKGGKIEYAGQHPRQRNANPLQNLHSRIVWELKIPAGKSRSLSADYHYYLRQ